MTCMQRFHNRLQASETGLLVTSSLFRNCALMRFELNSKLIHMRESRMQGATKALTLMMGHASMQRRKRPQRVWNILRVELP